VEGKRRDKYGSTQKARYNRAVTPLIASKKDEGKLYETLAQYHTKAAIPSLSNNNHVTVQGSFLLVVETGISRLTRLEAYTGTIRCGKEKGGLTLFTL